ncbi:MAG: hypothetical protein ACOC1S_01635 [bacterium]
MRESFEMKPGKEYILAVQAMVFDQEEISEEITDSLEEQPSKEVMEKYDYVWFVKMRLSD